MNDATTKKLLTALLAALTSPKATGIKKGASSGKKRNPAFKKKAKPDTTALCIASFEAKGYKNVQPKINVKTYRSWTEAGRKVIPGQKGTKVGPFTLFHIDQTEPLNGAAAAPAPKELTMLQEIEQAEAAALAAKVKAQNDAAAIAEYGV